MQLFRSGFRFYFPQFEIHCIPPNIQSRGRYPYSKNRGFIMNKIIFPVFIGLLFGIFTGFLIWSGNAKELVTVSMEPDNRHKSVKISSSTSHKEKTESSDHQEKLKPNDSLPDIQALNPESPMFSKALLEHFHKEFIQEWRKVRAVDPNKEQLALGEERFREIVLRFPAEIGRLSAEECNDKDALEKAMACGDGVSLIASVENDCYTHDPERFGELIHQCVTPRVAGPTLSSKDFAEGKEVDIVEGTIIEFGPGIHKLDECKLRGPDKRGLPSDVTIRGMGMDATLLRIGDIGINGDVNRLAFRNLTLDAENEGLFYLRAGSLVLDLENVRIVRFDAGHGGCTILDAKNGNVIKAINCEIIGGYGRSPGKGNLFDRGDSVLAHFTNCRIELLKLGLRPSSQDGHILFQNCTFSLLRTNPLEKPMANIEFTGCKFETLWDFQMPREKLRKDLGDLFWQLKE